MAYPYFTPYYPQPMQDNLMQMRQQYQPPQMQPMQQPMSQPVQQNPIAQGGVQWVSGEQEARGYLIAPNSAVALWDSTAPTVYLKQSDASGKTDQFYMVNLGQNHERSGKNGRKCRKNAEKTDGGSRERLGGSAQTAVRLRPRPDGLKKREPFLTALFFYLSGSCSSSRAFCSSSFHSSSVREYIIIANRC